MESGSNKFYVSGKDLNSSNSYCAKRSDLVVPRKLTKMTGCLEIISGQDFGSAKSNQDNNHDYPTLGTYSRPGSGRTDSAMSRRLNTPTKQISLQTVPRKVESSEPLFADQVNWQTLDLKSSNLKHTELAIDKAASEPLNKITENREIYELNYIEDNSQTAIELSFSKPALLKKDNTLQKFSNSDIRSQTFVQGKEISCGDKNKDEENDSDDDGDDDDESADDTSDDSEGEEKLQAPNELLMEFVDNIMRKDFPTASKLCKMILLYEPENQEALKFQPLIEERLCLDAEAEKNKASEDEDDSDDDDDSDSNDEDDDDSSDDDESDTSSDEDDSSSDGDDEKESNSSNTKSRKNNDKLR